VYKQNLARKKSAQGLMGGHI